MPTRTETLSVENVFVGGRQLLFFLFVLVRLELFELLLQVHGHLLQGGVDVCALPDKLYILGQPEGLFLWCFCSESCKEVLIGEKIRNGNVDGDGLLNRRKFPPFLISSKLSEA